MLANSCRKWAIISSPAEISSKLLRAQQVVLAFVLCFKPALNHVECTLLSNLHDPRQQLHYWAEDQSSTPSGMDKTSETSPNSPVKTKALSCGTTVVLSSNTCFIKLLVECPALGRRCYIVFVKCFCEW